MSTLLGVSAVIITLSALCSLSEAAFLSLPLARARALAKLGGRRNRAALKVRERVQRAISAIVILNTIVNMAGASMVGALVAKMVVEAEHLGDVPGMHLAFVVPVLTVGVVIFGEIVPKTLGERFHAGVALNAALPVLGLIYVFSPLVWMSERLMGVLVPGRSRSLTTEEEISEMAEQAHLEGVIQSSEAEVIQRVFRLNDFTAEDIMTPRIRCQMIPEDATLTEAKPDIATIVYARVPVFSGTRDNVTGLLRRTDALLALADGKGEMKVKDVAGKAKFVPATMTVDALLFEFQRSRTQFGIVVGEYGETIGIVTVEDILEELVGEILDEKDVDEHSIKRINRNEILVHGQTEVARINDFFHTELPDDRPTVAGLLLDHLGRLPLPGERVPVDGVVLVVDEANERTIVRVRIQKTPAGTVREVV